MNFFHHKDLGNHLLQLCPKAVKHPVYSYLKCIVYDKLLKPRQSFWITLYNVSDFLIYIHICEANIFLSIFVPHSPKNVIYAG